jgi:hypothetical protein
MFRAGQKVVCIDAVGADQLHNGGIYTVKEVLPIRLRRWRNVVDHMSSLLLYEAIANPHCDGFHPLRFRPVTHRRTDISIFRRMLVPSTKKELKNA